MANHRHEVEYKREVSDKIKKEKEAFNENTPKVKAVVAKIEEGESRDYQFLPIDWQAAAEYYKMKITIYSS